MSDNLDLFWSRSQDLSEKTSSFRPLADRLRPQTWDRFRGLELIDQNLLKRLRSGQGTVPSLVLWGPPGSGKTTLAKLIGKSFDCNFVQFSAVLGGVKEVREIVKQARKIPLQTVLFVDEIHRFNKAQQDAFLPHVENGTIALIGATTENPSFYLNGALLSRLKVLCLPALSEEALAAILQEAAGEMAIDFAEDALGILCSSVGGDARQLLNLVESIKQNCQAAVQGKTVSAAEIKQFFEDGGTLFYDRAGEEHYNMVSAFIKSLRGSDPDAALYWGFRMITSGEDPRFIIRRMMIFASEDIGNADPRALQMAVATAEAYDRLGLPEGRIPISHCITYLASAPKSNRSYVAMHAALKAIEEHKKVEVPLHLRNAPTALMKSLDYGKDYVYPHDLEGGYAPEVEYLPKELRGSVFYQPSERGYEQRIKERLQLLKKQSAK